MSLRRPKPQLKEVQCLTKKKNLYLAYDIHFTFKPISSPFKILDSKIFQNNFKFIYTYTGCPTRYRTQHSFNNFNTNKDIATKFEQEYVRCVRNEEQCVPTRYMKNPFIQRRLVLGVGCQGDAKLVPSPSMQPSQQLYIWKSSTLL